MNPKQFLLIGGVILVLVGILGMVGVIGPTASDSIFNKVGLDWWFDPGENWAHLILGVAALIAAFVFPGGPRRLLVMLLGIVGVLIGVYSLMWPGNFFGVNFENPADTLLHILVGVWALVASWKKEPSPMMQSSSLPGIPL